MPPLYFVEYMSQGMGLSRDNAPLHSSHMLRLCGPNYSHRGLLMNVLLCHSMTELNIDNICVIHALYTSYSMPEWGRKRIDSDSLWHIYKVSISSTCHNLVLRWRQYLKIQIFKLKFKFKICLLSTTTCRWNTWYIIMWHQYLLYIYRIPDILNKKIAHF